MFDEVITDSYQLAQKCIVRDGFVFVSVTNPPNVYDGLLIKVRNENNGISFQCFDSNKTVQEHIDYFNNLKLEKAYIYTDDLTILNELKTLKYLSLVLLSDKMPIDFTPLYDAQHLISLSISTVDFEPLANPVDCTKFKSLEFFSVNGQDIINLSSLPSVKTLLISNDRSNNLYNVFSSEDLDVLMMTQCRIRSLDGIEQSKSMQCLYLYYNRCLENIEALTNTKHTLRALRIENCSKIKDFSVLSKLDNLEHLILVGSNTLQNLNFLKNMKKLKTFVFDYDVLDGDLSLCKKISYVYSGKNRKHFNCKDKDLPKGKYYHGYDNIEQWRRYQ